MTPILNAVSGIVLHPNGRFFSSPLQKNVFSDLNGVLVLGCINATIPELSSKDTQR